MLISTCMLGYNELSDEITSRFKNLSYYKKRDSDTEGVRVHVTYVHDSNLLSSHLTHRYELPSGNFANVLNDGTHATKKESTISNDMDWLLQSDGHDTVIETAEDVDMYLDLLISLAEKGYDVYITSRKYLDNYWKDLETATTSGGGILRYCDDVDHLLGCLDERYQEKLKNQRQNLLKDSYNVAPCGFSSLN